MSNAVWADLKWIEGGAGLTIESYRAYWNGSNTIFEIKVKESFASTGCTKTDSDRIFSYWQSANTFHMLLQSQAAAANAMDRKIDVSYDSWVCDAGAGRPLMGIRVRPAP